MLESLEEIVCIAVLDTIFIRSVTSLKKTSLIGGQLQLLAPLGAA
jgi:hypothetical protein